MSNADRLVGKIELAQHLGISCSRLNFYAAHKPGFPPVMAREKVKFGFVNLYSLSACEEWFRHFAAQIRKRNKSTSAAVIDTRITEFTSGAMLMSEKRRHLHAISLNHARRHPPKTMVVRLRDAW